MTRDVPFLCETCGIRFMDIPAIEVFCSYCGAKAVRVDNEGQPIDEVDPTPWAGEPEEERYDYLGQEGVDF